MLTGGVYFAGTLYWITRVMVVYGNLQWWVAVLVNALLVAYLALFPALFAVAVRYARIRYGPHALMLAPFAWVATELGRTHLFGGFPWALLGYSQVSLLPVAQLASLLGVYGVSALVASVNAAVVSVAIAPRTAPGSDPARRASAFRRALPLIAVIAIVVGVAAWGTARVARSDLTRAGTPIRVGLIQGNVDQAEKWNPARALEIFQRHLAMTRQAIAQGAQMVLWPESSTAFRFEDDPVGAEQVRAIARQARVAILLGSDEMVRGVPTKYYNSAFVVRPDGSDAGVYRKMHLVPFGEYVPLKQVFFFAAPLVEAVSDFSPGESATLLPVGDHRVSTAICYEIVYPALVRRFAVAGSELLTTITNDAWFGRTSAPYQHFAQAAMRAVENGRYLVRSANTGISGIVDPYGRIIAASGLFEPAVIVDQARFLQTTTFYTQTGDLFAYASLAATLGTLVGRRRRVQ